MRKHNFYEGMIPMPEDFAALQDNAEAAVRESSVALSGAGVLEGLELRLDGAAKNLSVTAGKGLRVDGQLLQLGAAQDLKLPSDGKAYAVVLRYQSAETQERATTLQGEDTWTEKQDETSALVVEWTQSKDKQHRQADDLVLGTLQNGVLDLGKREVAQGWQAVKTQAQALKENTAALGGKGVLEGLELKLDATANKLTVQAGKALRADGQLLQLGAAQDLKLPSDSRGYRVVLRHEAQSGSTKAQLEQSPQADDLVLGQLLRDPQDAAKHVLDLAKREVARGWPSLTSAPFGVKSPLLTLNAGESSSSISTPTANVPHIKRTKTPYTAPFSARYAHQCVAFTPKGNSAPRLWLIGGNDGSRKNDVWSTADGITWQEHKGKGVRFSPRYAHQVVVFQNKLWVLGGRTNSDFSDEVWYSDDGKDWTQHGASPRFSPRYDHQCVVFKAKGDSAEKLWVIGGYANGSGNKNDVWSFDGSNWVNHGNGKFTARYAHQVVAFGGRLWLIGGYDGNYLNDVHWSEDGISWHKENSANFSPRAHQLLTYENKMWVIGGETKNGYVNDVWSTQDGMSWQPETQAAAFSPRYAHQAVVFNNKMWVIGGFTGNGMVADVWSSTDGVDWHDYAVVKEQLVRKEKRVAGLRVERGSAGQSVLAYAEDSGQWEIDGRSIALDEAVARNKAKLDALRVQLLGEIKAAEQRAEKKVQQVKADAAKHITDANAKISSAKQDALNAAVPIGFIYVQYPQQKAPKAGTYKTPSGAYHTVDSRYAFQWPGSWEIVNYIAAFFRAEDGTTTTTPTNLANDFYDETHRGATTVQDDAGRNVYAAVSGVSETFASDGGSAYAFTKTSNFFKVGTPVHTDVSDAGILVFNASKVWGECATGNELYYDAHDNSYKFRDLGNGPAEFRPRNYTVRIWERIA